MAEETFLDAPVTPAPIFAYRALRAVLWGEEETPEKAVKKSATAADGKAEHVRQEQRRDATFVSLAHASASQKRKLVNLTQPSPTKSILRTPGAQTPRRDKLRDINVTFKDLRKSTSPELKQKLAVIQNSLSYQNEREKENQRPLAEAQMVQQTLKPISHKSTENQDGVSALRHILDNGDDGLGASSYMRMTEKEMKRLIKYGQKMREYARRQNEENDKLRALLDEAQTENQRLQRQLDRVGQGRAFASAHEQETTNKSGNSNRHGLTRRIEARSIPTSQTARTSAVTQEPQHSDLDLLDLDNFLQPQPSQPSVLNHNPKRETSSTIPQVNPSYDNTRAKRRHPDNFDFDLDHDEDNDNIHNTRPTPSSPPKKQKRASPGPTAAASSHLPLRPITNSVSASTRLAPDRQAAARARLRKRTEARKASGEERDDENREWSGGAAKTVPGNGNGKVDTSLVDWAAL